MISGKTKPRVRLTSALLSGSIRVTQFCRKMRAGRFFSMSEDRKASRRPWDSCRAASPSSLPSSSMALIRYQLRQLMFMLA
ncbi:hypothetical protein D3C84_680120 [compost metagenome]